MSPRIDNPTLGHPQDYALFVARLAKPMEAHKDDLLHMAIGICG